MQFVEERRRPGFESPPDARKPGTPCGEPLDEAKMAPFALQPEECSADLDFHDGWQPIRLRRNAQEWSQR